MINANPIIDISKSQPQIFYLDQGVAIFACLGNPNGVIQAYVGSIAVDETTGNVYRKGSGIGNSGWVAISGGSGGSGIQTISAQATPVTNSGSTATVLHSVTIPANTLSSTTSVRWIAAGFSASNTNTKEIVAQIGGITAFDTTGLTLNGVPWELRIEAALNGNNLQCSCLFIAGSGNNIIQRNTSVGPLTLTSPIVAQIVGTALTTADLTQNLTTFTAG